MLFDKPGHAFSAGAASFTDPLQYNSYDFFGSAAGLLERDSLKLRLSLGTHAIRWHDADNSDSLEQKYTGWSVPDLIVGMPRIFYVRMMYAPVGIIDQTMGGQNISLPMRMFGLTVASQIPGGLFQFALNIKGATGTATLEDSNNERMILGCDDLSVTAGSRVHEMVGIGMKGGVKAAFDSLRDYTANQRDRYFMGQLPMLGWYLDFGGNEFPVQSDFSLCIGTHRFVYVASPNNDQNPIKGDSLAWMWQTVGILEAGACSYHPALKLGYWRNHYQQYTPTATNDDLNVGPKLEGEEWTFSDFTFGLGGSASLFSIFSVWIEYAHASMGLWYGSAYAPIPDKDQGYHSSSVGLELNIHAIEALRFPETAQSFFRVNYFNMTGNSGIDPFQSSRFGYVTTVRPDSRMYRYNPDFGWGPTRRISGTVLGLGLRLLEERLEIDSHVGFMGGSLDRDGKGFVLGSQIAWIIR